MVRPSQLTPMQRLLLAISLPITLVFLYFLFRKNDDEDDEEADAQVVTSRQTVIEVKVPHDAVGAVIGAQGTQIKMIKNVTKARLNFKDKDADMNKDRILVIQGTQEGAQKAELMVRQIIVDQPQVVTEVLRVPNAAVGRIIGRSGETIRSISHQSKAKVTVERMEKRELSDVTEILLKGTPLAVETAKMLILEKVEDQQKLRQKISSEKLRRTEFGENKDLNRMRTDVDGSFTEVYVSAVEHPGHFWVQLIDRNALRLSQLVDEMTMFYGSFSETHNEDFEPVAGDIVAAPFSEDNAWYRAQIVGVLGDEVDLYFVDYGDSLVISKERIRRLRTDFRELPFQAKECSLANVEPCSGGVWSEEAIVAFEGLVHVAQWKVLMSRNVDLTAITAMPSLQLIDTNGETDVDVAEELVRRGLAVRTSSKTLSISSLPSADKGAASISTSKGFDLRLGETRETRLQFTALDHHPAPGNHPCTNKLPREQKDRLFVNGSDTKILHEPGGSSVTLADRCVSVKTSCMTQSPTTLDTGYFSVDLNHLPSVVTGPYEGVCDHMNGNSYDGDDDDDVGAEESVVSVHQNLSLGYSPAEQLNWDRNERDPVVEASRSEVSLSEHWTGIELLEKEEVGSIAKAEILEYAQIPLQNDATGEIDLRSTEAGNSCLMLQPVEALHLGSSASEAMHDVTQAVPEMNILMSSQEGEAVPSTKLNLFPSSEASELLAETKIHSMDLVEMDTGTESLSTSAEIPTWNNVDILPLQSLEAALTDIPAEIGVVSHLLCDLSERYPSIKRSLLLSKLRTDLNMSSSEAVRAHQSCLTEGRPVALKQLALVNLANEYLTVRESLELSKHSAEKNADLAETKKGVETDANLTETKQGEIFDCLHEAISQTQSQQFEDLSNSYPSVQNSLLLSDQRKVLSEEHLENPVIHSKLCVEYPSVRECLALSGSKLERFPETGNLVDALQMEKGDSAMSVPVMTAEDDIKIMQSYSDISNFVSLSRGTKLETDQVLQKAEEALKSPTEFAYHEIVGIQSGSMLITMPEWKDETGSRQSEKQSVVSWRESEIEQQPITSQNESETEQQNIVTDRSPEVEQQNIVSEKGPDIEQQNIVSERESDIEQQSIASDRGPEIEQQNFVSDRDPAIEQQTIVSERESEIEQQPIVSHRESKIEQQSCVVQKDPEIELEKIAVTEPVEKHFVDQNDFSANLKQIYKCEIDNVSHYFPAFCRLSDYESGRIFVKPPVTCRPEWSTDDFDGLVSYIKSGQEKPQSVKHIQTKPADRHKKHDHYISKQEPVKLHEFKTKEDRTVLLPPNLAAQAFKVGLHDLQSATSEEASEDQSASCAEDSDDGGFTVFESRKRRRLRSRCSTEREQSEESPNADGHFEAVLVKDALDEQPEAGTLPMETTLLLKELSVGQTALPFSTNLEAEFQQSQGCVVVKDRANEPLYTGVTAKEEEITIPDAELQLFAGKPIEMDVQAQDALDVQELRGGLIDTNHLKMEFEPFSRLCNEEQTLEPRETSVQSATTEQEAITLQNEFEVEPDDSLPIQESEGELLETKPVEKEMDIETSETMSAPTILSTEYLDTILVQKKLDEPQTAKEVFVEPEEKAPVECQEVIIVQKEFTELCETSAVEEEMKAEKQDPEKDLPELEAQVGGNVFKVVESRKRKRLHSGSSIENVDSKDDHREQSSEEHNDFIHTSQEICETEPLGEHEVAIIEKECDISQMPTREQDKHESDLLGYEPEFTEQKSALTSGELGVEIIPFSAIQTESELLKKQKPAVIETLQKFQSSLSLPSATSDDHQHPIEDRQTLSGFIPTNVHVTLVKSYRTEIDDLCCHFPALCSLNDYESGRIQVKPPVKYRPEWATDDFDSLVSYIDGGQKKQHEQLHSHPKSPERAKPHQRSRVHERSKAHEPAAEDSKSIALPPNLAARAFKAGLLGIDSDLDREEGVIEGDDGFTVVESRKHRRRQNRHSEEKEEPEEGSQASTLFEHQKPLHAQDHYDSLLAKSHGWEEPQLDDEHESEQQRPFSAEPEVLSSNVPEAGSEESVEPVITEEETRKTVLSGNVPLVISDESVKPVTTEHETHEDVLSGNDPEVVPEGSIEPVATVCERTLVELAIGEPNYDDQYSLAFEEEHKTKQLEHDALSPKESEDTMQADVTENQQVLSPEDRPNLSWKEANTEQKEVIDGESVSNIVQEELVISNGTTEQQQTLATNEHEALAETESEDLQKLHITPEPDGQKFVIKKGQRDISELDLAVTHFPALCKLKDYEMGIVQLKPPPAKYRPEWATDDVDALVTYIEGDHKKQVESHIHPKSHEHIKAHQHTKAHGHSRSHEPSKAQEPATESNKIAALPPNLAAAAFKLGLLDIDADLDKDGCVLEEGEMDDSFTVVETRKHRRQRNRHSVEKEEFEEGNREVTFQELLHAQEHYEHHQAKALGWKEPEVTDQRHLDTDRKPDIDKQWVLDAEEEGHSYQQEALAVQQEANASLRTLGIEQEVIAIQKVEDIQEQDFGVLKKESEDQQPVSEQYVMKQEPCEEQVESVRIHKDFVLDLENMSEVVPRDKHEGTAIEMCMVESRIPYEPILFNESNDADLDEITCQKVLEVEQQVPDVVPEHLIAEKLLLTVSLSEQQEPSQKVAQTEQHEVTNAKTVEPAELMVCQQESEKAAIQLLPLDLLSDLQKQETATVDMKESVNRVDERVGQKETTTDLIAEYQSDLDAVNHHYAALCKLSGYERGKVLVSPHSEHLSDLSANDVDALVHHTEGDHEKQQPHNYDSQPHVHSETEEVLDQNNIDLVCQVAVQPVQHTAEVSQAKFVSGQEKLIAGQREIELKDQKPMLIPKQPDVEVKELEHKELVVELQERSSMLEVQKEQNESSLSQSEFTADLKETVVSERLDEDKIVLKDEILETRRKIEIEVKKPVLSQEVLYFEPEEPVVSQEELHFGPEESVVRVKKEAVDEREEIGSSKELVDSQEIVTGHEMKYQMEVGVDHVELLRNQRKPKVLTLEHGLNLEATESCKQDLDQIDHVELILGLKRSHSTTLGRDDSLQETEICEQESAQADLVDKTVSQKKLNIPEKEIHTEQLETNMNRQDKAPVNLSTVAYHQSDSDKVSHHFHAMCRLNDYESGKIQLRPPVKYRSEWKTNDVDSLVSYIEGDDKEHLEGHAHPKSHEHTKSHQHSKTHGHSRVHEPSKAHEPSTEGSKVVALPPNLAARAFKAGLLDIDTDLDREECASEEDDSFTVVESRKHKRQRNRHSEEKEELEEGRQEVALLEHQESLHAHELSDTLLGKSHNWGETEVKDQQTLNPKMESELVDKIPAIIAREHAILPLPLITPIEADHEVEEVQSVLPQSELDFSDVKSTVSQTELDIQQIACIEEAGFDQERKHLVYLQETPYQQDELDVIQGQFKVEEEETIVSQKKHEIEQELITVDQSKPESERLEPAVVQNEIEAAEKERDTFVHLEERFPQQETQSEQYDQQPCQEECGIELREIVSSQKFPDDNLEEKIELKGTEIEQHKNYVSDEKVPTELEDYTISEKNAVDEREQKSGLVEEVISRDEEPISELIQDIVYGEKEEISGQIEEAVLDENDQEIEVIEEVTVDENDQGIEVIEEVTIDENDQEIEVIEEAADERKSEIELIHQLIASEKEPATQLTEEMNVDEIERIAILKEPVVGETKSEIEVKAEPGTSQEELEALGETIISKQKEVHHLDILKEPAVDLTKPNNEVKVELDLSQKKLERSSTSNLSKVYYSDIDKLNQHFTAWCSLNDFESGKIQLKPQVRYRPEWKTNDVDSLVSYIEGDHKEHLESHAHPKSHEHTKSHQHSKTHGHSRVHEPSKAHEPSTEGSKVVALPPNLAARAFKAGLLDIDTDLDREECASEEDDSFTVVESRKHKRQRNRHSIEKEELEEGNQEVSLLEHQGSLHVQEHDTLLAKSHGWEESHLEDEKLLTTQSEQKCDEDISEQKEVTEYVDTVEDRNEQKEATEHVDVHAVEDRKEQKEVTEHVDTDEERNEQKEVTEHVDAVEDRNDQKEVIEHVDTVEDRNEQKEVIEDVDTVEDRNEQKEVTEHVYVHTVEARSEQKQVTEHVNVHAVEDRNEQKESTEHVDTVEDKSEQKEATEHVDVYTVENRSEQSEVTEHVDVESVKDRSEQKEASEYVDVDIVTAIRQSECLTEFQRHSISHMDLDETPPVFKETEVETLAEVFQKHCKKEALLKDSEPREPVSEEQQAVAAETVLKADIAENGDEPEYFLANSDVLIRDGKVEFSDKLVDLSVLVSSTDRVIEQLPKISKKIIAINEDVCVYNRLGFSIEHDFESVTVTAEKVVVEDDCKIGKEIEVVGEAAGLLGPSAERSDGEDVQRLESFKMLACECEPLVEKVVEENAELDESLKVKEDIVKTEHELEIENSVTHFDVLRSEEVADGRDAGVCDVEESVATAWLEDVAGDTGDPIHTSKDVLTEKHSDVDVRTTDTAILEANILLAAAETDEQSSAHDLERPQRTELFSTQPYEGRFRQKAADSINDASLDVCMVSSPVINDEANEVGRMILANTESDDIALPIDQLTVEHLKDSVKMEALTGFDLSQESGKLERSLDDEFLVKQDNETSVESAIGPLDTLLEREHAGQPWSASADATTKQSSTILGTVEQQSPILPSLSTTTGFLSFSAQNAKFIDEPSPALVVGSGKNKKKKKQNKSERAKDESKGNDEGFKSSSMKDSVEEHSHGILKVQQIFTETNDKLVSQESGELEQSLDQEFHVEQDNESSIQTASGPLDSLLVREYAGHPGSTSIDASTKQSPPILGTVEQQSPVLPALSMTTTELLPSSSKNANFIDEPNPALVVGSGKNKKKKKQNKSEKTKEESKGNDDGFKSSSMKDPMEEHSHGLLRVQQIFTETDEKSISLESATSARTDELVPDDKENFPVACRVSEDSKKKKKKKKKKAGSQLQEAAGETVHECIKEVEVTAPEYSLERSGGMITEVNEQCPEGELGDKSKSSQVSSPVILPVNDKLPRENRDISGSASSALDHVQPRTSAGKPKNKKKKSSSSSSSETPSPTSVERKIEGKTLSCREEVTDPSHANKNICPEVFVEAEETPASQSMVDVNVSSDTKKARRKRKKGLKNGVENTGVQIEPIMGTNQSVMETSSFDNVVFMESKQEEAFDKDVVLVEGDSESEQWVTATNLELQLSGEKLDTQVSEGKFDLQACDTSKLYMTDMELSEQVERVDNVCDDLCDSVDEHVTLQTRMINGEFQKESSAESSNGRLRSGEEGKRARRRRKRQRRRLKDRGLLPSGDLLTPSTAGCENSTFETVQSIVKPVWPVSSSTHYSSTAVNFDETSRTSVAVRGKKRRRKAKSSAQKAADSEKKQLIERAEIPDMQTGTVMPHDGESSSASTNKHKSDASIGVTCSSESKKKKKRAKAALATTNIGTTSAAESGVNSDQLLEDGLVKQHVISSKKIQTGSELPILSKRTDETSEFYKFSGQQKSKGKARKHVEHANLPEKVETGKATTHPEPLLSVEKGRSSSETNQFGANCKKDSAKSCLLTSIHTSETSVEVLPVPDASEDACDRNIEAKGVCESEEVTKKSEITDSHLAMEMKTKKKKKKQVTSPSAVHESMLQIERQDVFKGQLLMEDLKTSGSDINLSSVSSPLASTVTEAEDKKRKRKKKKASAETPSPCAHEVAKTTADQDVPVASSVIDDRECPNKHGKPSQKAFLKTEHIPSLAHGLLNATDGGKESSKKKKKAKVVTPVQTPEEQQAVTGGHAYNSKDSKSIESNACRVDVCAHRDGRHFQIPTLPMTSLEGTGSSSVANYKVGAENSCPSASFALAQAEPDTSGERPKLGEQTRTRGSKKKPRGQDRAKMTESSKKMEQYVQSIEETKTMFAVSTTTTTCSSEHSIPTSEIHDLNGTQSETSLSPGQHFCLDPTSLDVLCCDDESLRSRELRQDMESPDHDFELLPSAADLSAESEASNQGLECVGASSIQQSTVSFLEPNITHQEADILTKSWQTVHLPSALHLTSSSRSSADAEVEEILQGQTLSADVTTSDFDARKKFVGADLMGSDLEPGTDVVVTVTEVLDLEFIEETEMVTVFESVSDPGPPPSETWAFARPKMSTRISPVAGKLSEDSEDRRFLNGILGSGAIDRTQILPDVAVAPGTPAAGRPLCSESSKDIDLEKQNACSADVSTNVFTLSPALADIPVEPVDVPLAFDGSSKSSHSVNSDASSIQAVSDQFVLTEEESSLMTDSCRRLFDQTDSSERDNNGFEACQFWHSEERDAASASTWPSVMYSFEKTDASGDGTGSVKETTYSIPTASSEVDGGLDHVSAESSGTNPDSYDDSLDEELTLKVAEFQSDEGSGGEFPAAVGSHPKPSVLSGETWDSLSNDSLEGAAAGTAVGSQPESSLGNISEDSLMEGGSGASLRAQPGPGSVDSNQEHFFHASAKQGISSDSVEKEQREFDLGSNIDPEGTTDGRNANSSASDPKHTSDSSSKKSKRKRKLVHKVQQTCPGSVQESDDEDDGAETGL